MDAVAVAEIKSRRDFYDAFQAAMSGAHDTLRTLWHFEKGQNLPKSYLIEFHPSDVCENGWGTEAVFSALRLTTKRHAAELGRTNDDTLFWMRHGPGHEAAFVIDCLNPRFLIFHTLSKVEHSDRFIVDILTQYQPEFDLFWFPVSLLERTEIREKINGWQAQFLPLLDVDLPPENRASHEVALSAYQIEAAENEMADFDEAPLEPPARLLHRPRFNIDLEYQYAFETYKKLKEQPDLLPDMPLSAVVAERIDEDAASYARARIFSYGKITGRGPDFSSYLQIVNNTVDDYAKIVQNLESEYWIMLEAQQFEDCTQIKLKGKPFCIWFNHEIDVKRLVSLMFDCSRPFRLMGEPEAIDENYFAVEAVDLHVNQPVGFEITPNFMRIYLYEGTCGNTLVRIIRSLQHSVDSKLKHPALI